MEVGTLSGQDKPANPYPGHYRPAFAFSIILYPLDRQLPLRVACPLAIDWRGGANYRAYHVPCYTDAPNCDATNRLGSDFPPVV